MWIAASVYHSLLLFYLPCFMLKHGKGFILEVEYPSIKTYRQVINLVYRG